MRRLLLACVLSFLAGCATGRMPTVGEPAPKLDDDAKEQAYQALVARYSDEKALYDGLDTRVFVAATYQSHAFVEARVRRMGEFQKKPQAVVAADLEREQAEVADVHEFMLGVHVNDPLFDDFARTNSIWRLALIEGGTERTPVEVKRVGRATLNLRALYPFLSSFWVAYRVRFPRSGPEEHPLVLRVASTLGQADLSIPSAPE